MTPYPMSPVTIAEETPTTACRDCEHEVSRSARTCPHCGAPEPHNPNWDGYGYEYRSDAELFGLPLLHISFKYRGRRPVPAKGIIAIGQFGTGIITIAQFGIGAVGITQFGVGGILVTQFGLAVYAVAQIAATLAGGIGQLIFALPLR